MMSMLCNCCVRELLILARTWFASGLPYKTGCDIAPLQVQIHCVLHCNGSVVKHGQLPSIHNKSHRDHNSFIDKYYIANKI
jgi:hypothetical protein